MMDALAIEAAEAAVSCGYPAGAVAVLVIELDGPTVEVEAQFAQVEQIALRRGAFETRIAADAAERALMWKGRKSAFAAVGRISPSYFVQDGVIPRTHPPQGGGGGGWGRAAIRPSPRSVGSARRTSCRTASSPGPSCPRS